MGMLFLFIHRSFPIAELMSLLISLICLKFVIKDVNNFTKADAHFDMAEE